VMQRLVDTPDQGGGAVVIADAMCGNHVNSPQEGTPFRVRLTRRPCDASR
jgi:hypothetical protein